MANPHNKHCITHLGNGTITTLATSTILSSFVAVIGNIVILISIYRSPNLKTATNIYLASIAFADILCGAFVGPLWTHKIFGGLSEQSDPMTVPVQTTTFHLMVVNAYCLCALSYDRYLVLTNFIHYPNIMSKRRAVVTVLLIWILATILASSRFVFVLIKNNFGLLLTEAVLICAIPFVAFYVFTKRYACDSKTPQTLPADIRSISAIQKQAAQEMRKVYLVGIVVFVFVVSWLPYFVVCTVDAVFQSINLCTAVETRLKFMGFTMFLALLKSALNPFIYMWKMNEFRSALKMILHS